MKSVVEAMPIGLELRGPVLTSLSDVVREQVPGPMEQRLAEIKSFLEGDLDAVNADLEALEMAKTPLHDSARHLLAPSTRPQGVFCVTDLLALGFIDAARQDFQLTIPEDLCVIGFDDISEAGWLGYNLTTFRQPIGEISQYIADVLTTDERATDRRNFPVQVVWRRTVRP